MANRARAVKWGVPLAAVAVVAAAVGSGPVIAAVRSDPSLPDRTAEQLLADVARTLESGRMPQMSGTIVETASLGLPALPGMSGPAGASGSTAMSLLSGSHQLKIWYAGEDRFRLMLPGEMSETDLIADGDEMWLWDSAANKATRITAPAASGDPHGVFPLPSGSAPPAAYATPERAAREVLKAAGTDTAISVGGDVEVAGRAAYQIVLTPRSPDSLVRDVRVALDGETMMPLRVQVYAEGAAEPVFEVGFDSLSFTAPAPENFAFTPPPGAKVEQTTVPSPADRRPEADDGTYGGTDGGTDGGRDGGAGARGRVVGSGWDSVLVASLPDVPAETRDDEGRSGFDPAALLDALRSSATPVSGEWGSGRLLRTKLVSILLTDDGRLLAGAVTPEALYRAAAAG